MTDSQYMDLLVTAADNHDQIAPPAANEVRGVRAVMLLHERGETVYSSNAYELKVAANEAEAKSFLQQVRERASNDLMQIKTITAFGWPPAIIIDHAKRLNAGLIVMSSHGRSGIGRWVHSSVAERVLCGVVCATLVIRKQESIQKEGLDCMKEV
jgi:nucleotide-binding universal stress UspA family protein